MIYSTNQINPYPRISALKQFNHFKSNNSRIPPQISRQTSQKSHHYLPVRHYNWGEISTNNQETQEFHPKYPQFKWITWFVVQTKPNNSERIYNLRVFSHRPCFFISIKTRQIRTLFRTHLYFDIIWVLSPASSRRLPHGRRRTTTRRPNQLPNPILRQFLLPDLIYNHLVPDLKMLLWYTNVQPRFT